MPSVIVHDEGDGIVVRVSNLDPAAAAAKIAARFHHFSTDNETTRVEEGHDDDFPRPFLTVILRNEAGDDGSGPEHDLAHVLDFAFDSVQWALAQTDDDDHNLREAGVL